MTDCVFCTRRKAEGIEVFERPEVKYFFYFWDINPVTPGHLLVIPKRHVAGYRELNDQEMQELTYAVSGGCESIESTDLRELYRSLQGEFTNEKTQAFLRHTLEQLKDRGGKPDAYNHGLNDGKAAGRTVHHLHYHIMPRWTGDMEDPRGGIRHMFKGKGNYYEGLKSE